MVLYSQPLFSELECQNCPSFPRQSLDTLSIESPLSEQALHSLKEEIWHLHFAFGSLQSWLSALSLATSKCFRTPETVGRASEILTSLWLQLEQGCFLAPHQETVSFDSPLHLPILRLLLHELEVGTLLALSLTCQLSDSDENSEENNLLMSLRFLISSCCLYDW